MTVIFNSEGGFRDTSIRKPVLRPETLSQFKKLGKRRLAGKTAEVAKSLHDQRQAMAAKLAAVRTRRQKRILPLGGACQDLANKIHAQNPRLKNWEGVKSSNTARGPAELKTTNHGRYSSRCSYTHYTYSVIIRSWVVLLPETKKLVAKIGDYPQKIISAPRGYRWGADKNGVRLISIAHPTADFHPTAADLLLGARHCVKKLQENRKARWAVEVERRKAKADAAQAERIMRRAEAEGLSVCLRDSLRAGNCEAGTVQWASRHGLNPAKHYMPAEVLAIANGDTHRVALVVAVALRRHQAEMARGYSELTDHR